MCILRVTSHDAARYLEKPATLFLFPLTPMKTKLRIIGLSCGWVLGWRWGLGGVGGWWWDGDGGWGWGCGLWGLRGGGGVHRWTHEFPHKWPVVRNVC